VSEQTYASGCPHRELAVGWAMHALEPAEESLVAAHLVDCAECARTVAETEQVGAMLGLALSDVAIPSPELDQRVLDIANTDTTAPVIPLARPTARTANVVPRRYRILAAAAAVLLVAASIGLGLRVIQLGDQRDQAVRQVSAMTEAMRRAADPASVRVPLVNIKDGHPVGMVLAGPADVALVVTGLPGNRVTDQIYVLWGLGNGQPTPLGGFDVAPDKPILQSVASAAGRTYDGFAVSIEQGRHTPAAPTTVLASGKVAI
jgi:hypothetical protein